MKSKFFVVVLAAVVAVLFIGHSVSESADVGNMIKEQQQKLTEKTGGTSAPAGDNFDAKIKEQEKLIDKSVASKAISKEEAKILRENLDGIKKRNTKASADGKMSESEKDKIQSMLDRNNRMITDKKNNPVKHFSRPDVTTRFEIQQKSIDKGLKAGQLTKQEAAQLQDNLAKAKAKHASLTKDGKFTPAEEEKIQEMLDKDSQMIESKRGNEQKKKCQ